MITNVAKFDTSSVKIIPGDDWPEAVETARATHRRSWDGDYGHHAEFRTLGILIGGRALEGGEVDLRAFVESVEPPLDQKEQNNLRSGYNDVARLAMQIRVLEGATV